MPNIELLSEIKQLKDMRNAIILAHNYQMPEVQELADVVGDSFTLARTAAASSADVIVLCGVRFMAESSAILSPEKTVLLPAPDAGCPMSEMVDADSLVAKRQAYPDASIVLYVNSSASAKAEADICCTSSNAVQVVRSLRTEQVVFAPDKNLGHWVAKQVPEKDIVIWEGCCVTHDRVTVEELHSARSAHPDATVCIHPECRPELVALADYVGSTSQIIEYCRRSSDKKFIIGTEMGILHALKKDNPDKVFFILSPRLVCPNMKKTTVELVHRALVNMSPVVAVEEPVRSRARLALDRMLAVR